jgi:hypothetical protein
MCPWIVGMGILPMRTHPFGILGSADTSVVIDTMINIHDVQTHQEEIHDTLDWLARILADWKSHLLVEYSKDWFACELMDGHIQDDRYRVVDDIIYYRGSIYLVSESTLREEIMRAMHDTPLAGHHGYFRTYQQIRERFSWKGLKDDVLRHVRECKTCQQNKSEVYDRDCIYFIDGRWTKLAHFFMIPSEYEAP